jgi:hypothetical protein
MNTINNASLRNILKTCWFTPSYGSTDSRTVWGLPLMLAGDPGTGKTSMVTAEARALGMQVKVNIASISDPTDYGGIPVAPADGSRFAHMLLPQWAREVFGWQGAGVLVFDEFTTVSPAVQAALLRVVLERYVGDAQLPDRVRVVGAMNPPEQAAGGASLSLPMVNRFGHFTVQPADLSDWFGILRGEFYADAPLDADAEEARVLAAWPAAYGHALSLVQGFLSRRPDLAQKTPKVGTPQAEQPWTSRRSWEFAARAMAGATVHGLTVDERDSLLSAFVGDATAVEFTAWLRDTDLPDPAQVLDGFEQWVVKTHRPDRTLAFLTSATTLVIRTDDVQTRVERARVLWNILAKSVDTPDLAMQSVTRLSAPSVGVAYLPEAAAARSVIAPVARAVQLGGLTR